MKIKFFNVMNANAFEKTVNSWLSEHPSIKIVSTNSFANVGGWGYAILYTDN